MAASLSIGELAARTSVPISTLRYYDGLGLLGATPRESGRRAFPRRAIRRVALVRAARQAGLTLRQIQGLLAHWPDGAPVTKQWRALAQRQLPELELAVQRAALLRDLVAHCLECGCLNDESCELLRLPEYP